MDAVAEELDSQWHLSVGTQTVTATDDGGFRVPNITTPDQFGEDGSGSRPDFLSDDFVRLTGYKAVNGKTSYVWSQPFQITNGQSFIIRDQDLTFSDTPLVKPEFIRVAAPAATLTAIGASTQLTTTAIFPDTTPDFADNPVQDVTARAKFTVYRSSNPFVVTVGKDGLATARGNGGAIVTAVNSMVSGSLKIVVNTNPPTTVEGIVRKPDQSPVAGATVTVQGKTGTTDAQGRFSIADVPSNGSALMDVIVNGPPIVTRTVTPIPFGITDAGIILLGAISNVGDEFIVLFERNFLGNNLTQQFFMTSSQAGFGTIESPAIANPISFQLAASGVKTQDIPAALMISTSDVVEDKAIRVAADTPFQLYAISQIQFTTDAYTGIPVAALGTRYRAISYPNSVSGSANASQFAIAGTRDGTIVTITPSVGAGARVAGVPYTLTLNRLQSYQLQTTAGGADLTGTLIVADKPIAVFSGHACGNVPVGVSACDHMIEQVPSVDTWGTSFVTVSLQTRLSGDIIRILANEDDTTIQVRGGTTVDATLNAGQTKEFVGLNINQITASKPVLVAQYSRGSGADGVIGDPFMMIIPPTAQFLSSYIFTTPTSANFTVHFVNVVAKSGDAQSGAVLLDGTSVPATSFTAIPGTDFSAARLSIARGNHAVTAPQPLGIYVYGFGSFDSYGYPGGLGLQKTTP